MLQLIVKSRQLIDIEPSLNKHANMTFVVVHGQESRSVKRRDWKTLRRSSANNMLTSPPYDGPRVNFANSHCITVLPGSLLPAAAGLHLVRREDRSAHSPSRCSNRTHLCDKLHLSQIMRWTIAVFVLLILGVQVAFKRKGLIQRRRHRSQSHADCLLIQAPLPSPWGKLA
jgi:hypothetical protein